MCFDKEYFVRLDLLSPGRDDGDDGSNTGRFRFMEYACNRAVIMLHLASRRAIKMSLLFSAFTSASQHTFNWSLSKSTVVDSSSMLFLVSLLDHPLFEEIVILPPLSLQFIWSVEDSEATLPPPPTLYMSSSSLSIRSVTEYRFRFNSCCWTSPDGVFAVIIAVVVVVVDVNTGRWWKDVGRWSAVDLRSDEDSAVVVAVWSRSRL